MDNVFRIENRAALSPGRRYSFSPVATVAYIRSQMRCDDGSSPVAGKDGARQTFRARPRSVRGNGGIDPRNRLMNDVSIPVLGETNPVFGIDASRCPVFEGRLSRDENGYCMNDLDRSQKDASRKVDLQESRSHKKVECLETKGDTSVHGGQLELTDPNYIHVKAAPSYDVKTVPEAKLAPEMTSSGRTLTIQQENTTRKLTEMNQAGTNLDKVFTQPKREFGSVTSRYSHSERIPGHSDFVDKISNVTDNFKVSQRFPGLRSRDTFAVQPSYEIKDSTEEPFYRDAKRIKMEHSDQTVKVDRGQLRPSHGHRFDATAGRGFPSDIQSMTNQFPGNARPKPNTVKKQMYSTGNDPRCQGNQNSTPSYLFSGCVAQASGGQHLTKTESLTWDPGQTAVTSTPLKPASEEPDPSSVSTDRPNNLHIGEPAMLPHPDENKQLKQPSVSKDATTSVLLKNSEFNLRNSQSPSTMQPTIRNAIFRAFTQLHNRDRGGPILNRGSAPAVVGRSKSELKRIIKLKPIQLFPESNVSGSTSGKQRKDWPDAEGELRESSKENTGTRHDNTGNGRWKSTLNSGISDSLFKGKLQHRLESSQQSTDAVSIPGDYRGRLAVSRPGDDRERLAASRPGDDRERLGRRLTNELNVNPVRHAKSVDIAAIYSQPPWRPKVYNDDGTVKSDIKPAGGHLPGSDTKTSVSSKVAPSLDKLPFSLTSGDCDDRQDIITDDVIRTGDEEEFRPGMVFLQELHNVDTDRGHHAGAVRRLCETKRPEIFYFRDSVPVRRKTLPASTMHTLVPAAIESSRTAVEQILHPRGYSRRSSENFNPEIRNYLNQHSQTGGLHFAKPVTIGRCDIKSGASDVQGDKQPEGRLNECFHRRHTLQAYRLNTIEELDPTTTFDAANRQTAVTKQRNIPASPQKQSGVGPDSPPLRQIQIPFFNDENLREDVQRSDQPRRHSESFGAALSRKPTVHILPLSRQTSSETLSSGYRSMDRKETLRRGRHFKSGSADADHTHGLSLSLSTCDFTHVKTPRKCRVDSNCSRPAVDLVQIHESHSKPPWIVLDSERCSGCNVLNGIHGDENLAAPDKPDFRVNLLPVNRNSVGETAPKVSNNVLPSWSEVLARQSRDQGPVQSPDMLVK